MAVSSNMGNWMTYSQWMASTKSTKSPPSGHPWRSRRALRKKNTKLLVHETGKFQVLKFFHILVTATAACCLKILSNFEKFRLFSEWLNNHKLQASTSIINLGTLPLFPGSQGSTPNHIGMVQLLGNLDLTLKPLPWRQNGNAGLGYTPKYHIS